MKVIKFISARTFFRFTCFMFWLVTCPAVMGQANQKRLLTPGDYNSWCILSADKISNEANWVSYRLHQEYYKKDTLVLQKTSGGQKYVFPNAKEGKFNAEFHFGCISKDTLYLYDLRTGAVDKTANTRAFDFSADHSFTVIVTRTADQRNNLEIRNMKDKAVYHINNITSYCFDPEQKGIAYSTLENNASKVELFLFKKKPSAKL